MSLRRRFTLLCAVFLGLAVAASGGGAAFYTRARDAAREHARLNQAVIVAGDLRSSVVTQAAAIRAYFLNADAASYGEFTQARSDAAEITGQLQGLISTSGLRRTVEAVTQAALKWRTEALNPLIALEQQGAYQQVIEQYAAGPAIGLFQKVTTASRALQRDIAGAENTAAKHADTTRLNAIEYTGGVVVVIGLAALLIRAAASAWLVRPVAALADTMRSADPVDQLAGSGGPSELRDLARSSEGLRLRLHEELKEAARSRATLGQHSSMLMSLRARSEVQADQLPAGWDYSAQLVPAAGVVAGDCYDISVVGARLTMIVVDVVDQGVEAAFASLRAKELVRAGLRMHGAVGDGLRWASEQMPDAFGLGVTAFVASIDCATGTLTYANAGHPEAVLCDGVQSQGLRETGPEFATPDATWATRTLTMLPGQVLIAYTDGLVVGRRDSRRFGLERLSNVVRDNYGDSCDVIVKQVLTEAGALMPGGANDDIAIAVIARAMPM
ncbi:MAG: SpoIIE family protein phosphatase [Actinobacteria bacterium]|nr:SpoIIE family protein phosphatase [Actinomycetota bacterium]